MVRSGHRSRLLGEGGGTIRRRGGVAMVGKVQLGVQADRICNWLESASPGGDGGV